MTEGAELGRKTTRVGRVRRQGVVAEEWADGLSAR
jgi:hypothetical protein